MTRPALLTCPRCGRRCYYLWRFPGRGGRLACRGCVSAAGGDPAYPSRLPRQSSGVLPAARAV